MGRRQRGKLTKHGVTATEVGEALLPGMRLAGRIVEPAHAEPRWLCLGRTTAGRHLAIIATRRGGRLRPISCRAMRAGERRMFDAAT